MQLNGFVDTAAEKDAATRVAHSVNGVQNVRNNLTVGHTERAAGEVVDDSVVTTKVKAALIAEPTTKARDITVVTREGIVQLSGFVDSPDEKATAAQIARGIAGVKEVRNDLAIPRRSLGSARQKLTRTKASGALTRKSKPAGQA